MFRFTPPLLLLIVLLVACQDTPTEYRGEPPNPQLAAALDDGTDCSLQNNNTAAKLTTCVTIAGVRAHQAAFQAIADANGGVRSAGTPGYDQSADYVATMMSAAGYAVSFQTFSFDAFRQLGPSTLSQLSPLPTVYVEDTDYNLLSHTDPGDVTGPVVSVDLMLGPGNNSSSGCEAADFAGFPPGAIALIQRGTCSFELKAENAAAAGAVGAIIFNQGNTTDRVGLINGTLGSDYTGGIPAFFATYDRGVEWDFTTGLTMNMVADVFRGTVTSANVIAQSPGGLGDNVVMAGAHLDSTDDGPGIQDNGSGSAALLETAIQMKRVKPRNKMRFVWWGATEFGLVGSLHYVSNLSSAQRSAIALYLNFDMIGSPNFVNFISDGDGSAVGSAGPTGSAAIEKFFEDFYSARGHAFEPTPLGRTDDFPFAGAGIPVGGIFSGADGIKTPAQAAMYGGTAGDQYDPCYHLACDTFDNISLSALDVNSDAVAAAVLQYAMSTESVNGRRGKGNFNSPAVNPGAPGAQPVSY